MWDKCLFLAHLSMVESLSWLNCCFTCSLAFLASARFFKFNKAEIIMLAAAWSCSFRLRFASLIFAISAAISGVSTVGLLALDCTAPTLQRNTIVETHNQTWRNTAIILLIIIKRKYSLNIVWLIFLLIPCLTSWPKLQRTWTFL